MAYASDPTRTIVLKARRDTVVLVVAATAATFALASAIHSRPDARDNVALPQQQWAGELAGLASVEVDPVHAEPITSASLVVPTSDFALPPMPVRALVKLRGCDGGLCAPRTNAPTPVRRPIAAAFRRVPAPHHVRPTLISRLNPLNHLPDMSTLGRPFAVASDTVSGWFKRF